MNNDIKEILDNLIRYRNEDNKCQPEDILTIEDVWQLLDYITNLQTIEQQYSAILSENAELDKYKEVLDNIKEKLHNSKEYKMAIAMELNKEQSILIDIDKLLEEIE